MKIFKSITIITRPGAVRIKRENPEKSKDGTKYDKLSGDQLYGLLLAKVWSRVISLLIIGFFMYLILK